MSGAGSQPLVSAVIIFLNAERFIREAVESVLAQTYDGWELLLVDDGSTDGSSAIVRRYAARHPTRLRYLDHSRHARRGMSASRNLGIRHARGEYIALLDADDVWLPDKLERQVALLVAQPTAGMVCGTTEYWYSWSGDPADRGRDTVPPTGLPADALLAPPLLLLRVLRGETKPPATCSVLLRRQVVDAVGGFEENFRGMYEDQAFFAKICLAVPVFVTGHCSARYRQHAASCYARARSAGTAQVAELVYLRWLARHLARHRRGVGQAWRALDEVLRQYRHPLAHRLARRASRVASRLARLLRARR